MPTNLHSRECFDHAWKCATENLWTALGDDEATVADVQRQLAEVTSAAALCEKWAYSYLEEGTVTCLCPVNFVNPEIGGLTV